MVVDIQEDLKITADKNLSMQVLINLVRNAMEAMEKHEEQQAHQGSQGEDWHVDDQPARIRFGLWNSRGGAGPDFRPLLLNEKEWLRHRIEHCAANHAKATG